MKQRERERERWLQQEENKSEMSTKIRQNKNWININEFKYILSKP